MLYRTQTGQPEIGQYPMSLPEAIGFLLSGNKDAHKEE